MIRNNRIFGQFRMKFLYVMFKTVAIQSGLLLLFLTSLATCTDSENLVSIQLEFLVFGPNDLLIKINGFPDEKFNFITLRLGVRRSNQDLEDVEYGDNYLKNGNFYINDKRLQLKTGDIINYLIAYRNSDGYHAKTGKYTFNGVYRSGRNRRSISDNAVPTAETLSEYENTRIARHQQYGFHPWGLFKHNSFGGPHGPPPFNGGGPPFGAPPPFAGFPPFDPHHHHKKHGHGNGGGPPFGHNHHKDCNSSEEYYYDDDDDQSTTSRISTTTPTITTTKTTTEYSPDIDIRFGN